MKTTSISKSTFREIKQSFGRFAAILAIVALGVGLFAGLKITKHSMILTTGKYLEETKFFDYRLLSTLGFEEQDLEVWKDAEGIAAVEGAYTYDILYESESGRDGVLKAHSITDSINQLVAVSGRLPKKADECVVDVNLFPAEVVGKKLVLSRNNGSEDTEHFAYGEYTIVGTVQSPYYIQFERGNTALGTGRIDGFVYLLPEGFTEEIYTEVYVKLSEDYPLYNSEYKDYIESNDVRIEELTVQSAMGRYDRIVAEAQGEIDDARAELSDKKAEGETELSDAWAELEKAKKELDDGKQALIDAGEELSEAEVVIKDKEKEIKEGKATLAEKEEELAGAEKELADGWAQWQQGNDECNKSEAELNAMQVQLDSKKAQLQEQIPFLSMTEEGKVILAQAQAELMAYEGQLSAGRTQVANARGTLYNTYLQLEEAQKEIYTGAEELKKAKEEIAFGEKQLKDAKEELTEGRATLEEKTKEYEEGLVEYEDGLAEYEDAYAEFTEKIAEAEAEIADAEAEIAKLEKPETYVLSRDTNVGYVCFESDSAIVEGIANVFPVFFFLVAALVCMTTMNRMVEEQRTQIGVLKALGYSNGRIMSKYMIYSGLAATLGALIGYFGGTWLFPRVLWVVYGIMYRVDDTLLYVFSPALALISLAVSLLCSVGTTWFSCRVELKEVAAQLMRPKAPKAGKRVFLEYVPFLWKRLGFLKKVSLRNVFRYKKRLFMMVLGISGCTALLITGFGIKDSIANVANQQFEEIQIYDIGVNFTEEPDTDVRKELGEHILISESTWDIVTDEKQKAISLIVADREENIADYLDLHTQKKKTISYPKEGEAVVTYKVATELGIKEGDILLLRNESMQTMEFTVAAINENFLYNYVYIDSSSYKNQIGEAAECKTAYVNVPDGQEVYELSAGFMKLEGVTGVSVNEDTMSRITNMLDSLNLIVIVIIICAAGLAFIVLYNLTNINITERIREIATIKVLGFYKRETSKYVFRENLILTFFGVILGMFLGKALHIFVMNEINVDMIAFDIHILPVSYAYSVLLTFVFAIGVNAFMGRKLEKISMTESLKSVD